MNSRSFPELLAQLARKHPEKPYFISTDNGQTLSYRQLYHRCMLLGEQFSSLGYAQGDKVSVYMPNSEQAAVLLLAIMAHGLVANPINLLCQTSQLRHILRHSDTRLIFTTDELAPSLLPLLAEIDRPIQLVQIDRRSRDIPTLVAAPLVGAIIDPQNHDVPALVTAPLVGAIKPSPAPVTPDQDALLMYTSGTTGVPKGVLLTQENLLENARNIAREHQLTASDRVLGSLPLYHINGLVVTVITPLIHEGSVAMATRFSAASFWQDASRYQCTWINVVPTIIAYLLNDKTDCSTLDLSRLRFCRSASSALPPERHRDFEKRFGIGIIETMGLTETAAPSFSNPYPAGERQIGSVGKPSGTQARVIDNQGHEVKNGVQGEIILSGANVMHGYYKDPLKTKEAFTQDGWLRTGDIGYQDDQGFFYVTGRAKELIIKGGENIAPREIDEAVIKHPCVLDAASVGAPHPDYGQDIAVYLVLRENATFDEQDMRRHCLKELGQYKSPSKYVVVQELPRGPSGKVQRLKLLDL
ncbi:MAG: long-chain fatty acid--CoA ligase [Candidimonas sp.]|nr:MAG: long-chain fatty acid--CoA ligase [Candidimonas sp.]TAM22070.1 MAG: long-chain fatty acid--CoA ligase [Candidimonas sp.]TAM74877.1 MAG: long-chain fatty acid--CoA ligase [Candidimonas sp.]